MEHLGTSFKFICLVQYFFDFWRPFESFEAFSTVPKHLEDSWNFLDSFTNAGSVSRRTSYFLLGEPLARCKFLERNLQLNIFGDTVTN